MQVAFVFLQELTRHRRIISSRINKLFNITLKFNYFSTLCSKIKCRVARNEWMLKVGSVHTKSLANRHGQEYVRRLFIICSLLRKNRLVQKLIYYHKITNYSVQWYIKTEFCAHTPTVYISHLPPSHLSSFLHHFPVLNFLIPFSLVSLSRPFYLSVRSHSTPILFFSTLK